MLSFMFGFRLGDECPFRITGRERRESFCANEGVEGKAARREVDDEELVRQNLR